MWWTLSETFLSSAMTQTWKSEVEKVGVVIYPHQMLLPVSWTDVYFESSDFVQMFIYTK